MRSPPVLFARCLVILSFGFSITPLRAQDIPIDSAQAAPPPSAASEPAAPAAQAPTPPAQADAASQKQSDGKKGQTAEAISGASGAAETTFQVTRGVVDATKGAGETAVATQATKLLGGAMEGAGVLSSASGLISAAKKDGTAGIVGEGAQQAVEKVVATAGECIAGPAGQAVATVAYKGCRYVMDNTETGKAIQNKEVDLLVALKNNVEGTPFIGAPGENSPEAYTNKKLEKALKDSGMTSGSGTYASPVGGSGPNTDVDMRRPGAKAKIAADATIQINPNADLSGLFRSPYTPAPKNPPATPSVVNVRGPQSVPTPGNASRVANLKADMKTITDAAAARTALIKAQQKQDEEDLREQQQQAVFDAQELAEERAADAKKAAQVAANVQAWNDRHRAGGPKPEAPAEVSTTTTTTTTRTTGGACYAANPDVNPCPTK